MTATAKLLKLEKPAQEGLVLGPAEIVEVTPASVRARLSSGDVVGAELALAFTYQPAIGDVALVVGDGRSHYVIGILKGSGKTTLDLPGDVDLRASGKLRLLSDQAVEIAAPTVSLASRKLDMIAGAVAQRFKTVRQRVTELLSVHAGEQHTIVEGSAHSQSKRASILTEDKVTINGREVHLG